MKDNNLRDIALTDIVQMLEPEGTFAETVYTILEKAEGYLNTTNAALLQINFDRTEISTIIDYKATDNCNVTISNIAITDFVLGGEGIVVLNSEECSPQCKPFMEYLGVKTSVTVPIIINGMIAMYFAIFDVNENTKFTKQQIQFINDVSKIVQSIAQKKVINNSLLSSYEVLTEILGNIGSGIVVCNKYDGSILFENKTVQESKEVRRTIKQCIQKFFAIGTEYDGKPIEHYDSDSGMWYEIKFADLRWIDGSKVIICTAMDITQKKKNQQKIEYQAHNDFLTGLYNRMKCEHDLQNTVQNSLDNQTKGALMFIDLDDFKRINDSLGHQYGDILLQQIAVGLLSIPGLRNHCYRMGGDEFVIIIQPEVYENIDNIISDIELMFNKPWYLDETEYYCTMSIGIVTYPDNGEDVNDLVKKADIAMYQAKKAGKNRFVYYDADSHSDSGKRLDIENNIRQAVASSCEEFVVFYQPVVDTYTRECTSCEALVRWDSKVFGLMSPGEFIPLAEYLGLITSIGDYVLEQACKQCFEWNNNGHPDFCMNVNLSVIQLLQNNVVDNVRNIMESTGVNPKNIVLEITETFAINDMNRVMRIIEGLKELGPQIALDDFGTGYSSLNYIKQFPLDIIKVDKTFIDDIVDDEYAQAFIKLIVNLSKTIGTNICVEGVEHEEQYELLKELGADYIQGYYFGKPVNSKEFEKINFKKF